MTKSTNRRKRKPVAVNSSLPEIQISLPDSPIMGGLLAFFLIILVLFLILATLLYFNQGRLLYYPDMPHGARRVFTPPGDYGLQMPTDLEEIFITTPDNVRIQVWLVKCHKGKRIIGGNTYQEVPTIIFFCGKCLISLYVRNNYSSFDLIEFFIIIILIRNYLSPRIFW